jgi:Domain of unknown function (DUF4188)
MAARVDRTTVDLSSYPDLVVIYLGLRVQSLRGLFAAFKLGPQIQSSVAQKPDGLLLHEQIFFSFFPPHVGMRQYWRDFESLEKWVRTMPHQGWWINFLKDPKGTGFWHETYFMRGGMESIYDNVNAPLGFLKFAPRVQAIGPSFSARKRAGRAGESPAPPVAEDQIYGK